MQPPTVRLHLYFATGNDRAVILRQGPSRMYRMILWHRDSDRFEDGQWLKHRVYTERCDLSPDGRHFLYFALNGDWSGPSEGAYSAISRPPYFTALALFPEGSTWGGGGRFLDDGHFVAVGGDDIIGQAGTLTRLMRHAPAPGCPSGLTRPDGRCARLPKAALARLTGAEAASRRDPRALYETRDGILYRRAGGRLAAIRDFTQMRFAPVRAPYHDRKA